MPVLKRVPVKWCFANKVNTQFEPTYEVQVELTPAQAKALVEESKEVDPKGKGIKIKKEEDGTLTYRFRRKESRPDGTLNHPPVAVGKDGKTPFTENIGNGSICNVQYIFVKYEHPKFGAGVTNDFKGIQVIEHVEYGEKDGGVFEDEGEESYTPNTSSKGSDSFDDDDF